jgi:hypothetical protein
MILVRYTTQFLKLGYDFPCTTMFESVADMMSWKSDMEDLHGCNFKILKEWEHLERKPSAFDNAVSGWLGSTGKCEGSTDACILGMDY